jgi:hypothetical protein
LGGQHAGARPLLANLDSPDPQLFPGSDAPGNAGETTVPTGGDMSSGESTPSAISVGPDADYWLL